MYSLMLKDTIVAEFTILTTQFICSINKFIVKEKDLIPLGIKSGFYNVMTWLESRYILVYKKETKEFFKSIGIETLEQFIDITNCTSLNDCYWVKSSDSRKRWENVSLYRNPFNENISHYSFTGKMLSKNVGSSPDFSTDGSFPKCWKRINGDIYLLKAGTSGAFNAGNEPYSEIFACQLADYIGLPIIRQEISKHKGVNGKCTTISKCRCICDENIGLIKINELYNKTNADFEWLIKKHNCKEVHCMLMLDYLLCNVDRHFGNVWLTLDVDSNKPIGFTPVCDNNLSCIPYYTVDEDLAFYINDIRAKDGRTWDELLNLIDKKVVLAIAKRASKFKFKPVGDEKGDSRIEILNNMLKYQLSQIDKIIR